MQFYPKEEVKNRGKQGPTHCFLIFCGLANIPYHSRFFRLIFLFYEEQRFNFTTIIVTAAFLETMIYKKSPGISENA